MAAFPLTDYSPEYLTAMTTTKPSRSLADTYISYVVRVHARDGIKTLSFDALAAFFTCTSKQAAEQLGISSRTLIRVCRSLGIRRWPYLSFRSEKDIERIREDAILSLRLRVDSLSDSYTGFDVRGDFAADVGDFADSMYGDDGGFDHTPQHGARPQRSSLSRQRISPRKDVTRFIPPIQRIFDSSSMTPPQEEGQHWDQATITGWSPSSCALRCPPPRTRAMSMHDILSVSSSPSSL